MYALAISSICIQLIICLPLPRIAAIPNFIGFTNSGNAPPPLPRTIPVRSITSRLSNSSTGFILSSHILHALPKKLFAAGSGSLNGIFFTPSSPYHPIAEADTTVADEVRVEVGPGDLELPRGAYLRIQDVEPRSVAVQLDSTFQRVVPVRAVVRLAPEAGQVLTAIAVVPGTVRWLARLTPSGALTEALAQALSVSVDWFGIAVVTVWGLLAAVGAVRWFRFS